MPFNNINNHPLHIMPHLLPTSLKLPRFLTSKIKHFVWQVLHDNLPTTANLAKRRIFVNQAYKFCGSPTETEMHVFHQCPYAKDIAQRLNINILQQDFSSLPDLFEARFRNLTEVLLVLDPTKRLFERQDHLAAS